MINVYIALNILDFTNKNIHNNILILFQSIISILFEEIFILKYKDIQVKLGVLYMILINRLNNYIHSQLNQLNFIHISKDLLNLSAKRYF